MFESEVYNDHVRHGLIFDPELLVSCDRVMYVVNYNFELLYLSVTIICKLICQLYVD